MRTYTITGANNEILKTFYCLDGSGPSDREWRSFVAMSWQKDPDSILETMANNFPGLIPVENTAACCFGPPIYNENGQKLENFKFPEMELFGADRNDAAYIQYDSGKVQWFGWDDFIGIVYEDRKVKDLNGDIIKSRSSLKPLLTKYGVIVFKSDMVVRVVPESTILKANKAYPAILHYNNWSDKALGYVFVNDQWLRMEQFVFEGVIFKLFKDKEFFHSY